MRGFTGILEPVDAPVGTGGRSVHARNATAAGDEIGIGDTVAFLEALPQHVGLHPATEAKDFSHHFMPGDEALPLGELGTMTVPDVQIRTADVGTADADQNVVGTHVGKREFPEHHLFPGAQGNGGDPLHRSSSGRPSTGWRRPFGRSDDRAT